jgi:hypothetical protein
VLSGTARFMCVTAARAGVPRVDQMVSALGLPTDEPTRRVHPRTGGTPRPDATSE